MKIDKDKFYELWNNIYNRQLIVPSNTAEYYYLSGCLDTMRKIQNELQEIE